MRKTRRISNRNNVIRIIIGTALLGLSVLLYNTSDNGQNALWGTLSILSFLIGLVLMVGSVLAAIRTCLSNKELACAPYKYDFAKELSTYAIVGNEKKKLKNGAIRCSNYSEWEKYINEEFCDLFGNENFYHFLVRKIRISKAWIEIISSILIPVEILVITTISEWLDPIQTIILIITLAVAIEIEFIKGKSEINYLKDFIGILFPKKIIDFSNGII